MIGEEFTEVLVRNECHTVKIYGMKNIFCQFFLLSYSYCDPKLISSCMI